MVSRRDTVTAGGVGHRRLAGMPIAFARERPVSLPFHDVVVDWDVRIPARDGIELSANIWRPRPTSGPETARSPVVLEMIPYGKDSWRRNADVGRGEWFAARGYAFCRLDVRGTGSSGGVARDEYTEAETQDGYDAVEWLAAQPWSSGKVGMWGISYGGFTAIQVAKLGPPHLAAIVPFYATDDRYRDDVHYRGGCVTASELSQYAVSQVAMNAMPPDPAFRGDGWLEEWRRRLEATPIWLFTWLRHQVDGPYWRQGSLAPDYAALRVPIFQVGGWNDSYVDPVLRIAEHCSEAQVRSIIGNWVHAWPHDAFPGPGIDDLHEVVRFLDRHLKDQPNGLDEEPAFTWFEREWAPPEPFPVAWPGRWRATAALPHPGTSSRSWTLDAGGGLRGDRAVDDMASATSGAVAGDDVDILPYAATVGTTGTLSWGAGGAPNGLARDARRDEARGLTYTSQPLVAPVSILGFPEARLHVAATMPIATIVARLMDVAPDETGHQVAAGVLNLSHRDSDVDPAPLEPGTIHDVTVPMRASGYRFAAGHRIRLTLAAAAWPIIWPSPMPGRINVHRDGPDGRPSRLVLPVIPDVETGHPADLAPVAFKTTPPDVRSVGSGSDEPPIWRIVEDVLAGTVTVETSEAGTTILEDGRSLATSETLTMTASDDDPAHTRFDARILYRWREHAFETEIRSRASIRSDETAFELDVSLEVDLDGRRLYERHERERIPRQLV